MTANPRKKKPQQFSIYFNRTTGQGIPSAATIDSGSKWVLRSKPVKLNGCVLSSGSNDVVASPRVFMGGQSGVDLIVVPALTSHTGTDTYGATFTYYSFDYNTYTLGTYSGGAYTKTVLSLSALDGKDVVDVWYDRPHSRFVMLMVDSSAGTYFSCYLTTGGTLSSLTAVNAILAQQLTGGGAFSIDDGTDAYIVLPANSQYNVPVTKINASTWSSTYPTMPIAGQIFGEGIAKGEIQYGQVLIQGSDNSWMKWDIIANTISATYGVAAFPQTDIGIGPYLDIPGVGTGLGLLQSLIYLDGPNCVVAIIGDFISSDPKVYAVTLSLNSGTVVATNAMPGFTRAINNISAHPMPAFGSSTQSWYYACLYDVCPYLMTSSISGTAAVAMTDAGSCGEVHVGANHAIAMTGSVWDQLNRHMVLCNALPVVGAIPDVWQPLTSASVPMAAMYTALFLPPPTRDNNDPVACSLLATRVIGGARDGKLLQKNFIFKIGDRRRWRKNPDPDYDETLNDAREYEILSQFQVSSVPSACVLSGPGTVVTLIKK